ncbi:MAG: Helix-turn-helix of insertion element transposase [Phycisphaerales bacterium]|nr:Helix-turn-helix of insertion element transposase [Phycisphaerales bacterium]
MDTISSNGGSPEPIPTSSNPIPQASPAGENAIAGPGPTLQCDSESPVDADDGSITFPAPAGIQPVAPPILPLTTGLSAQQQIALAALASGQLPTAAAKSAGVVASTLYRWRKQDPAFIAALNAWRNLAQEAAHDRVLAMAGQATATVMAAMQSGDARTALTILKGLGAITPSAKGPEDIVAVRRAADRDTYRQYVEVQRERIEQRTECALVLERGIGKALIDEDKKQARLDGIEVPD